jgi:putative FmdB family regulatory protein
MPNYEYVCPTCQKTLHVMRSIHEDDPGYECDNCKVTMTQVLGGVSITFKGGGWAHKD